MNDEKKHILRLLGNKIRFDGRAFDEFREITIECGVTKNAEGSARVLIGDTEVIAGVKMSVEKPFPDTPEEGILMIGTELLPLASPEFESGPPDIKSIEISRVVDRGIREAKVIDLKKLCIEKGEKAWAISVDICPVNDAGNLMDASALAAIAAIRSARFPKYDGSSIDYKTLTQEKLPVKGIPIQVTVSKIGSHLLVDPTTDEEALIDARLTIALAGDGRLSSLQKGGDLPLTIDEVDRMIQIAESKAVELGKKL